MKVRDLMHTDVRTCTPDDTLQDAARQLRDGDCGFLPIQEKGVSKLVGTLTDRDVAIAAADESKKLSKIPIGDVMAVNPQTCGADDELAEVHRIHREHQVRRVPVVDEKGLLVGVVSLNDLSRLAADTEDPAVKVERLKEVGETLAAVSRHTMAARV